MRPNKLLARRSLHHSKQSGQARPSHALMAKCAALEEEIRALRFRVSELAYEAEAAREEADAAWAEVAAIKKATQ